MTASRPGRNDSCHCGSGKKYKKCHLRADQAREREEKSLTDLGDWVRFHTEQFREQGMARRSRESDLDEIILAFYAGAVAPQNPLEDPDLRDHLLFDGVQSSARTAEDQLAVPPIDPRSPTAEDQQKLQTALIESHATLYEVIDVRRGRWVKLRDRLTDETKVVKAGTVADELDPMEVIVGRIVSARGENVVLNGWRRVTFQRRKAIIESMIALMEASIPEAFVPASTGSDDAEDAAPLPTEQQPAHNDAEPAAESQSAIRARWLKASAPKLYQTIRVASPEGS